MVLPSDVVEPEEAEEKTDRTKEVEPADGKEGKVKEGAEEVPTEEELGQAVVVVPTPPDTGKTRPQVFATPMTGDSRSKYLAVSQEKFTFIFLVVPDNVPAGDDVNMLSPPAKRIAPSPPEDPGSDQPVQEQLCDPLDDGTDPAGVAAISLSKTPIMRMKSKSEPKRIAVSLKAADEGFGGGNEGDVGGDQEPIEAPLGPMTPVEMLLHDSLKLGGAGLLVGPPSEQLRKSSVLNTPVLPPGLAQVRLAVQSKSCGHISSSRYL